MILISVFQYWCFCGYLSALMSIPFNACVDSIAQLNGPTMVLRSSLSPCISMKHFHETLLSC